MVYFSLILGRKQLCKNVETKVATAQMAVIIMLYFYTDFSVYWQEKGVSLGFQIAPLSTRRVLFFLSEPKYHSKIAKNSVITR